MSLPGGWEWLIILLFALIFFGAKRLPEMARGLGKGIREFKNAVGGLSEEIDKAGKIEDQNQAASQAPPQQAPPQQPPPPADPAPENPEEKENGQA
jgi:sec-independent protein translocase protein TatA